MSEAASQILEVIGERERVFMDSMSGIDLRDEFLDRLKEHFAQEIETILGWGVAIYLSQLREKPDAEWDEDLRTFLSAGLERDPEWVKKVFENLVELPERLDPKDPQAYLRFNEVCVKIFRDFSGHLVLREPNKRKVFTGVAHPRPRALYEKFAMLCKDFEDSSDIYASLMAGVEAQVGALTKGEYKVYPISGSRVGWTQFLSLLKTPERGFPHVVTSSKGYFPMVLNQSSQFSMVDQSDPQSMADAIDVQFAAQRKHQAIVLIPSVTRDGQTLDVSVLCEAIRKKNPEAFIVIDAAQDALIHSGPDAILYSKRFGGTGTGALLLRTDADPDLHDNCRIQHGLDIEDLARLYASLHCDVHAQGQDESDLLVSRHISEVGVKGSIESVQRLRPIELKEQLRALLASHPKVGKHFEVDDGESAVVNLRVKVGSKLNLMDLAKKLKSESGVIIDVIEPDSLNGFDELLKQSQRPYSPGEYGRLRNALIEFQFKRHAPHIACSLMLSEFYNNATEPSRELYRRQQAFLRKSAKEQRALRLYLGGLTELDEIKGLLETLESTL